MTHSTHPTTEELQVKKGQHLELTIDSLAYGGKGVARKDDFVIFVTGGLPGQQVHCIIARKKRNHAEARIVEIIKESPYYVEPKCRHFGQCGGCLHQHLEYSEQLKQKAGQVKESLNRIGGLNGFKMFPTVPSPDIYYYRNKMEFSFSRQRWLTAQEIATQEPIANRSHYLGFHARGFYEKVIDLKECHLVQPVAVQILEAVRKTAKDSKLPVYSTRDHQGFWRFLVIRPSVKTSDLMVNVITYDFQPRIADVLKANLKTKFPRITSLINGTTQSKASVAFCEEEHLLHGKPSITEQLGPYSFMISSNSFFQTNTKQAERLYDIAVDFAEFSGEETVYDLYCGAGTISIYISSFVNTVIGFESVASAVQNARDNAALNDITNCEFVLGDLKTLLRDTNRIKQTFGQPDIVVLDPPRGGMHPDTVEHVLALRPEKIVHVACNPTTLARELAVLCKTEYVLTKVQPVDMFPHTPHIEVVAQLKRRDLPR